MSQISFISIGCAFISVRLFLCLLFVWRNLVICPVGFSLSRGFASCPPVGSFSVFFCELVVSSGRLVRFRFDLACGGRGQLCWWYYVLIFLNYNSDIQSLTFWKTETKSEIVKCSGNDFKNLHPKFFFFFFFITDIQFEREARWKLLWTFGQNCLLKCEFGLSISLGLLILFLWL